MKVIRMITRGSLLLIIGMFLLMVQRLIYVIQHGPAPLWYLILLCGVIALASFLMAHQYLRARRRGSFLSRTFWLALGDIEEVAESPATQ